MKKHTPLFWAICLIALSATVSCHKREDKTSTPMTPSPTGTSTATTPSTDKTKLNQLFAGLKSAPQTFTVNAGMYQKKQGAGGTVLTFYPNSFKTASGAIITSGTIDIQLTEMLTPGQMIANRASTTSNGKLLISGGQVYISATKAGQKVYANNYGIAFPQTAPSSQPMALYYGATGNADSVTTWTVGDTTGSGTTTNGTSYDSSSSFSYIQEFDSCTNFNWINCDYFYASSAPLTDVRLVVPDTSFNQSNTEVFLVFPTINSVTYMGQYDAATHAFHLYSGYNVPVGLTIHIVVITKKGSDYYYYQQKNMTTTSGMSVSATMSVQTLSYILTQFGNL